MHDNLARVETSTGDGSRIVSIAGGALVYTPKETAQALKVSLRTVERLIHGGKLKALKVGNQWRIHRTDLMQFIQNERATVEKTLAG